MCERKVPLVRRCNLCHRRWCWKCKVKYLDGTQHVAKTEDDVAGVNAEGHEVSARAEESTKGKDSSASEDSKKVERKGKGVSVYVADEIK